MGFFNAVPFFQSNDLKETLGFRKENYEGLTFGKRLLWILEHRYSYLIGGFLGFLFFFFIPVSYLTTNYPIAVYAGLMALCLPFLVLEVYRFFRIRRDKFHNLLALAFFGGSFLLSFALYYLTKSHQASTLFSGGSYALLLLYIFLGTFVLSFSGMSLGTILFLGCFYLPFASGFNSFLYGNGHAVIFFLLILALLAGYIAYQTFDYFVKMPLNCEKHAFNAGIFLAGIILIAVNYIKEPYYTDISEEFPQLVTILTTVFACLFLGVGLTIHGYRQLNKEDYRELNSIPSKRRGEKR